MISIVLFVTGLPPAILPSDDCAFVVDVVAAAAAAVESPALADACCCCKDSKTICKWACRSVEATKTENTIKFRGVTKEGIIVVPLLLLQLKVLPNRKTR